MPTKATPESHEPIHLDTLTAEFPHIPPVCGATLAQAAILCLDKQGHASGVPITVRGSHSAMYDLHWSDRVMEPMQRFWNDWDQATE